MTRTLKKTRARGLSPKLLLSRKQDATGSYPTVWRTSSDNRTGKYPVLFNDNKVVAFNQSVTDVGFSVTVYPEYEEKVVEVGFEDGPVTEIPIAFDNVFTDAPIIVITEVTSAPNTPIVNAFVSLLLNSGTIIGFSAPFQGTIVYRALYQPLYGNPVNVLRSPRYTDQYSLVVAENNVLNEDTVDLTFSDFGSAPTENYISFWDYSGPPFIAANITGSVNSTFITNTAVQVTASAQGFGAAMVHYMGFGQTTANVDVKGIVFPLGMTPEAINAGLSPQDKSDLYKQPYFSGSTIVNQPIVASGSMIKGVSDTFVTFTPGQDVQPFKDFANPEVDAKITNNPFYATGSAATVTGQGFQQPLWSKNKIEIDITPAAVQSFTLYKSASAGSYPMGYWNPNTKLYEGIGTGKGIDSYSGDLNGLKQALEEQTFGYTFSMDNGGIITDFPSDGGQYNLYGRQTSTYGFPYHPKFQPTSSQQILASNFISEPFLLEKIVLEISGSAAFSNISVSSPAIWSFFLLNSRQVIPEITSKEQNVNYTVAGSSPYLNFTTSSLLNGNILDVIDSIQVVLASAGEPADQTTFLKREQNITAWSSFSSAGTGSFQLLATSVVKSPISYNSSIPNIFSGSGDRRLECILNSSGRNQYSDVNGRDWINSFEKPAVIATGSLNFGGGNRPKVFINEKYTKPNPYILLPTDKITFGFQLPYQEFNVIRSNTFTFATNGINKIILYGSTLRINPETNQLEEYHDTLNQLLSSDSVHEIIGE